MKFKVDRLAFLKELDFVRSATEKRQTTPALSWLLMEAQAAGVVKLTGTDLDVTARCEATADVETPGDFCLPAHKLYEIVRSLDDADVSFSLESNDRVSVVCGRSRFSLAGASSDKFAEIPHLKTPPLAMPADVFKAMVGHVSYATTQAEQACSGIKFIYDKTGARMVATDRHRLAFVESVELGSRVNGTTLDALTPRKALALAAGALCADGGEISVGADENLIYLAQGRRSIVAHLLTGQFFDYTMVIPRNPDYCVEMDSAELAEVIKRAALIHDHSERPVRLSFTKGSVSVGSEVSELGSAEESIPAEYEGADTAVGFTSAYLLDALNAANGGRISFEFKNSNSQFLLKLVGGELGKLDVVMPRRL